LTKINDILAMMSLTTELMFPIRVRCAANQ